MAEFIMAIGFVMVIEGFLYALFPAAMKNMIKMALEQSDSSIRLIGLIATFIGLAIIYASK